VLSAKAKSFGLAGTLVLGVFLPLFMVLATKSSPLLLGIAAVFSLVSFLLTGGYPSLKTAIITLSRSFAMQVSFGLFLFIVASLFWAHNLSSSSNQFVQFIIPVISGLALAVFFPSIAAKNRALPWVFAVMLAATVITVDLRTGLKLREFVGGRVTDYSYNRAIVTLCILIWPLLALLVVRKQLHLCVLLLPLPLAIWTGASGAAGLALLVGIVVFPIARSVPAFSRVVGLWAMIIVIAISPFFGTLSKLVLGTAFHKALEGAHSSDRVDIWLSFEAMVQKKWLFGNGFGSSLNLQNAAVAQLIPPDLVTLLGASHPHNAFLQLWVELGLVGAAFAIVLTILMFRAVGKATPALQPFLLTWIAVVAGVSLVSHGAWQAWWMAAIAASAVGFLTVEYELKHDATA
jgi:exopolysaccharide production protein ExoQ